MINKDETSVLRLNKNRFSGYGVIVGCGFFLLSLIPSLSGLLVLSALSYWAVFVSAWPRLNPRNK